MEYVYELQEKSSITPNTWFGYHRGTRAEMLELLATYLRGDTSTLAPVDRRIVRIEPVVVVHCTRILDKETGAVVNI